MKRGEIGALAVILLIVVAIALSACTLNPAGGQVRFVTCLPKGVYGGEALGLEYTPAQRAAIDALRVQQCANAAALGYDLTTPPAVPPGVEVPAAEFSPAPRP